MGVYADDANEFVRSYDDSDERPPLGGIAARDGVRAGCRFRLRSS